MMTSELEYLERDWEITVLPQPKAPGIAVVPPYNIFKFSVVLYCSLFICTVVCLSVLQFVYPYCSLCIFIVVNLPVL